MLYSNWKYHRPVCTNATRLDWFAWLDYQIPDKYVVGISFCLLYVPYWSLDPTPTNIHLSYASTPTRPQLSSTHGVRDSDTDFETAANDTFQIHLSTGRRCCLGVLPLIPSLPCLASRVRVQYTKGYHECTQFSHISTRIQPFFNETLTSL